MKGSTHYVIDKIKDLGLPTKDFAIFGSGPMMIHGLKELIHDIDIVARGEAWEMIQRLGNVEIAELGDKRVTFFNKRIEAFNGWKPGGMDRDMLIDEAEIIDGLPWVHIEHVLEYKKILNREKDQDDIEKLEHYLAKHHKK